MIQAIFDGVIIKPQSEEETRYGNLIVPDLGKEKSLIGEVISVGPGKHSVTGNFIETTIKLGQKVIIAPTGATRTEYNGEEYLICNEQAIIGIIKDDE